MPCDGARPRKLTIQPRASSNKAHIMCVELRIPIVRPDWPAGEANWLLGVPLGPLRWPSTPKYASGAPAGALGEAE